ncbi:hypothetical protein [Cyclobacterium plantarum]|uniref:Uncharacterized protein n=1 Tax=Cyclobacterium plantarum TaxID=2716263 RepID=A0ABX0HGB5_9BACT|nr:hypothetical protein [Cyclobacterium plantarum]NHE59389.1 hypothetical protein [Cyclobacterium plantarum]
MIGRSKEKAVFSLFFFLICVFLMTEVVQGQQIWETGSYPDEAGFQERKKHLLQRLSEEPFGKKSQGTATCPDTGLTFKTWAVEGETVYSPFTGRAFTQGPTGYFGARERAKDGQIVRFGGDALKKDLIPAIARLMLQPSDSLTKAWLSIPGNLQQQYHFAAKNWARFYPLLADEMDPGWKKEFQQAVASYAANDRPSDGYRKYAPLSTPHDLVGEPGKLLGGNPKDGGTENHKIMWRTSAWVYAQYFPDTALISGWPVHEVDSLVENYFRVFYQKLLETGNGEYDAEIYYPHSLEGLMNVYDFAKKESSKELAKAIMDYFLATLAIKTYDGAIAGAQKRAPQQINAGGELSGMLHLWFGSNKISSDHLPSVHQLSSGYRPNKFTWDLYHKNFPLPFSMKVSRPSYHMDQPNQGQEYFYGSQNFGLGSIYVNKLDNPNQQVLWSLVVKTKDGPKTIGGGQPFHLGPGGHSPYTQTMQQENTLLLAVAGTSRKPEVPSAEYSSRASIGSKSLVKLPVPDVAAGTFDEWFEKARFQEAAWLFLPKDCGDISQKGQKIMLQTDQVYIGITPFSDKFYWLKSSGDRELKGKQKILEDYHVLVVEGGLSGYALEVYERNDFASFARFRAEFVNQSYFRKNEEKHVLTYHNMKGDNIEMTYNNLGLRARGKINGTALDFENWSSGACYTSSVLNTGKGYFEGNINGEIFKVSLKGIKISYEK